MLLPIGKGKRYFFLMMEQRNFTPCSKENNFSSRVHPQGLSEHFSLAVWMRVLFWLSLNSTRWKVFSKVKEVSSRDSSPRSSVTGKRAWGLKQNGKGISLQFLIVSRNLGKNFSKYTRVQNLSLKLSKSVASLALGINSAV